MNQPEPDPRRSGVFEAWVNGRAATPTAEDRALLVRVTTIAREVIPASQVRWAGSQRKGTAVVGSDLDLILESRDPVTEAQRRALRTALESGLRRPAAVRSHAVRLGATGDAPRLDLSFANAAFGSRTLPQLSDYHDQPRRQAVVRALKLWTRAGGLPFIPGWALEALVVHLDPPSRPRVPLSLFLHVVGWLEERATPAVIEGVLRPAASPQWHPIWSERLPGRLEALKNHARALRRRWDRIEEWQSPDDAGRWLTG